MSNIKTGGAAFPTRTIGEELSVGHGMTLRDYFAAKAMQGLMSCEVWNNQGPHRHIAEEAYSMADAMMTERGD